MEEKTELLGEKSRSASWSSTTRTWTDLEMNLGSQEEMP